ncbi:MAG TPA: hypothetical protein PK264_13715, partial [Hyphomicrobiaceae bacterium]|nr:hypothetical protein [Hyphomicrobiaceae bacterium]
LAYKVGETSLPGCPMTWITASARNALLTGLGAAAAILLVWKLVIGWDLLGLLGAVTRFTHVGAVIVWIGMVWFVNFIQIAAIASADDTGRRTLLQGVVPRVAWTFRMASNLTVASGLLLLYFAGYLSRSVVSQGIPPMRHALLWLAVVGGFAMWSFVHHVIWPSLQIVLREGDPAAKAAARERVHTYARINLALAVPVTLVMVAAGHLY